MVAAIEVERVITECAEVIRFSKSCLELVVPRLRAIQRVSLRIWRVGVFWYGASFLSFFLFFGEEGREGMRLLSRHVGFVGINWDQVSFFK